MAQFIAGVESIWKSDKILNSVVFNLHIYTRSRHGNDRAQLYKSIV